MPIKISKHGTMISGDSINFFRIVTLQKGLELELKGIRMTRGRTCYALIKEEFGLKGSRQKVLTQFKQLVEQSSAQQERIYETKT